MGWKLIGRLTGIVLFLGAFVAANAAPIGPPLNAQPQMHVAMDPVSDDVRMQARAHLPALLAQLDQDHADVAVRVSLTTETGPVTAWVRPIARTDRGFHGRVIDAAGPLPAGAALPVATSAVQDWHLIDRSGRMYGAFATRVLLSDLPATDAAAIRRVLSDSPVPTL